MYVTVMRRAATLMAVIRAPAIADTQEMGAVAQPMPPMGAVRMILAFQGTQVPHVSLPRIATLVHALLDGPELHAQMVCVLLTLFSLSGVVYDPGNSNVLVKIQYSYFR